MLKLTPYEQDMLDGKYGRFKQLAMEQTVKYAKVLGAEELIPITKVHLNMGIPPLDYGVDEDFNEAFRRVYLAVDEKVKFEGFSPECYVQTDGGAVDQYDPRPMRLSQEFCALNRKRELISAEGGTSIVGSCTPYLVQQCAVLQRGFWGNGKCKRHRLLRMGRHHRQRPQVGTTYQREPLCAV